MGSPKAAKSMLKQRIWRHRLIAPFAAVLITAVLALVVFSGLFAQDPNATSEFTAVNVANTRPVREKSESTAASGSPNKEDLAAAASDQEFDDGNSEPNQAFQGTMPAADEGGTATAVPAQLERSTGGSEPEEKQSPPQDQE